MSAPSSAPSPPPTPGRTPTPGSRGPAGPDERTPVFVISVAAELSGMHPQTLRQYDRIGLVSPGRTAGRGRRYSPRDVQTLRRVQQLSQEEGINLAGIKRIIALQQRVGALQQQVDDLLVELADAELQTRLREAAVHASYRRELVPFRPRAVVLRDSFGR